LPGKQHKFQSENVMGGLYLGIAFTGINTRGRVTISNEYLRSNSSAPPRDRLLFAQSQCKHQQAGQAEVLLIID